MNRITKLLAISKKHLRLKCTECKKLLPYEHFKNKHAPSHTLVCVSCKKLCISCGINLPLSEFYEKKNSSASRDDMCPVNYAHDEEKSDICRRCAAKSVIAHENVFYRYPILKYKACPFSADAMREQIIKEGTLE